MAEEKLKKEEKRSVIVDHSVRRLLFFLYISFILNVILVIVLLLIYQNQPRPISYAVIKRRPFQLIPLSQPNLSKNALLQWSIQATTAAYTYNFNNYQRALNKISNYFTDAGWQSFQQGLESSGNLDQIISEKLSVNAVPVGAPVIIQEGPMRGRYAWRIQVPLLITYQSASQQRQQSVLITLLVTRISTREAAKGIGIAQFVAQ